jgi:hypothetical protein
MATRKAAVEIGAALTVTILIGATLQNAWGAIPLAIILTYWVGVARGKGVKASEYMGIQVYDPNQCTHCDEIHKGTDMVEHFINDHRDKGQRA